MSEKKVRKVIGTCEVVGGRLQVACEALADLPDNTEF